MRFNDIVSSGIVLWIVSWALFKLYVYRSHKRMMTDPDRLGKILKYEEHINDENLIRPLPCNFLGFIPLIVYVIVVTFSLSEVVVITESHELTGYHEKTEVYVPWNYHGQMLGFARTYVSNETDAELTIYSVTYFNGEYSSKEEIMVIPSGEMRKFGEDLEMSPPRKSIYCAPDEKFSSKTIYHIDETEEAHADMNRLVNRWDTLFKPVTILPRK